MRFNQYDRMSPLNITESNESFAAALRQRVGARMHKLYADSGTLVYRSCHGAHGADREVDAWGLHGLHCPGDGHRIAKHDTVAACISQMCQQAGVVTKMEPRLRQWAPEEQRPPDPDGAAPSPPTPSHPFRCLQYPPPARPAMDARAQCSL